LIEVGEDKRAHISPPEHVPDAPERPPDFAKMLRNRLSGADFAGVSQQGFDRVLTFSFERDDENTEIVAELFGQGNIAALDETGTVVDCLDTVRLQSRTVAPGAVYEYPDARFHPFEASAEDFAARMADSDTDLVRTLATQLNFGGLYAEELCTRAGVEKTLDIEEAGEEDFDALYRATDRLADALEGSLEPRLYYERDADSDDIDEDGEDDGIDGASEEDADSEASENSNSNSEEGRDAPVDVTPLSLEEYDELRSEPIEEGFNAALDAYFTAIEGAEAAESGGDGEGSGSGGSSGRPDFEAEIEKQKRIIAQQEGAIEDFEEQAQAEREKAESLYSHYDLVDDILSTVGEAREADFGWEEIEARFAKGEQQGIPAAESVHSVDPATGTITIELDGERIDLETGMGVERNADRLYTEAKRIGEKEQGAQEAIENTRENLAEAKQRREQWEADDEPVKEGTDEDEEETDWLAEPSIPVRMNEQWYERFRWFRTSEGFLVLGGRNADQNEDLVKKYMDRGDRFLHTQVEGGPVTVLKATGPSEPAREIDFSQETLEEAAQFAVSYSTVWKNGRYAGDVYMVDPDQVSKTPESGEYVEKGAFVIRGDRTYFDDTPVGAAVGISCEPETRVLGGPPAAIEPRVETSITLEPGRYAQNDAAKTLYRKFRERFRDTSFVRKIASPDKIAEFLPAGGSRIVED
jgi:predicted ribosome quality control (RQC) complex YloA/Tae2 family protein